MAEFLEVWKAEGAGLVPLSGERLAVGRAESNDIALPSDRRVSRMHAVFERLPSGWCVRDLSSRNGTFVNGRRVDRDRPWVPGDEIQIGGTRLVLRGDERSADPGATEGFERPPELTPRERDVLRALFRPALDAGAFSEPATTREIAAALSVSDAAVKQHLLKLYDKFGIYGEGERRRVRLANEALQRGAVTLAEVRSAQR